MTTKKQKTLTLDEALEQQPTEVPQKETPKNIYQKLHAIMEAIEFIEKDKRNEFHKYNYASEEAIKKAVHKQLVKNRVIFSIDISDMQRNNNLVDIIVKYTFTDIDTLEKISGSFNGCGEDKGDKALYKAITGAIKYILTSTFLIPTGDDPEVENKKTEPTKEAHKSTPKETEKLSETVVQFINDSTNKEALQSYANNLTHLHTNAEFIKLVRAKLEALTTTTFQHSEGGISK